jgi:hypothetical protein
MLGRPLELQVKDSEQTPYCVISPDPVLTEVQGKEWPHDILSGSREFALQGSRISKNKMWTMSTLFTSDWLVQPQDWPGFRMFSRLPSNNKAWNPVRVLPRARQIPSSRGFLL